MNGQSAVGVTMNQYTILALAIVFSSILIVSGTLNQSFPVIIAAARSDQGRDLHRFNRLFQRRYDFLNTSALI
jgi:hypothetical protein